MIHFDFEVTNEDADDILGAVNDRYIKMLSGVCDAIAAGDKPREEWYRWQADHSERLIAKMKYTESFPDNA